MKKIKFSLLIFLAIASLTFTSCSDDDDLPSYSDTYVKFTLDGTDYNFENVITAESASITLNANNGSGISDPGDTQIALWLPLVYSEGTYDVSQMFSDDDTYQISFSSVSLDFDFDFAKSGKIIITKKTKDYVEGTFNAEITNDKDVTKVISNGKFRAMNMD